MRTVETLRQLLSCGLKDVHQARVRQVFSQVGGLIRGGQASVTSIGRSAAVATTEKHGIKRADRAVGNVHLHRELVLFWRALASVAIGRNERPWILVDWTEVGRGRAALSAAVVARGRALCVACSVHHDRQMGNARVQGAFLKKLARVIPLNCRPIIVSDAGFKSTWFAQVRALGWDFVGRLQSRICLRREGVSWGGWTRIAALERKATRKHQDCGEFLVTKDKPYLARLVTFDGRSRRAKKSVCARKRRSSQNKNARRARHPLVVATSVSDFSAKTVTRVYQSRMQIEETFRDDKSRRFGWGLEHARSRSPRRIEVLLLLIALATLAAVVAGFSALANDEQRHYQANTVRSSLVLSPLCLGRRVLARLGELSTTRFFQGLQALTIAIRRAHRPTA